MAEITKAKGGETVVDPVTGETLIVRYNKGFIAKLRQSDDSLKQIYSTIKNELLAYKRVKARNSWKAESYRFGRQLIVKMVVRGKALCLYLALDPAAYEGTKYAMRISGKTKTLLLTPGMFKVRTPRKLKYALKLIADLAEKYGMVKTNAEPVDYVAQLPYAETPVLVEEGLAKVVKVKREEDFIETELPLLRDDADEAPAVDEAPVADEPVVAEEAPIVDEAPVVDEPVVDEPVVADEAPAVDEAPVADEAPVVDEAPVAEEAVAEASDEVAAAEPQKRTFKEILTQKISHSLAFGTIGAIGVGYLVLALFLFFI